MLEVIDLEKIYDKRGIAGIRKLSFSLTEGKVAAILGPNGSGKTSLLNIIRGSLPLEKGEVKVKGPIAFFDPTTAPQEGNVQKFLIESVTVTQDEEKKLQLTRDLADILEFTFQLRQDLSDLSAGQKQKVLLASVLINRPSLILLDEPFSHLDPMTRKIVLDSLFDYIQNHQIAVLWVTHDLNEAFLYSDEVGVMNHGKLEQWGSPENVCFSPTNLFVAQFVGYKNILPIKREGSHWITPWGQWEKKTHLSDAEALMIIPETAWRLGAGDAFHYKNKTLKDLRWMIEAERHEKSYYFNVSESEMRKLTEKTSFLAEANLEDCLLIKL